MLLEHVNVHPLSFQMHLEFVYLVLHIILHISTDSRLYSSDNIKYKVEGDVLGPLETSEPGLAEAAAPGLVKAAW